MEITTAFNNRGLNLQEQCTVKSSLIEIKLNENFKSTRFWGKIFGIENDYLIIEATSMNHQIQHKYFFSIDGGLNFAQLPIVEPWMNAKCNKIAAMFTGITSYVYEDEELKDKSENEDDENEDDENEEEANGGNEDEQDQEKKDSENDEPPKIEYKLRELARIAWTISSINDECCIVPKDSLVLTSSKIMQKNRNFTGLNRNDANKLDSYLHFRTPRDPYSVSKYRKATAMNDTEFLDPITNDLPKGCWRLQSKSAGLEVNVKNLLWPGFEFKYCVGDSQYVQGYFGNGIRQNDLVFMI
mmetsp:Transcript_4502/g.3941  ORF Transcript_4502/g.3941 Transcript_4502/m.3941 type:complete len:299 (+) Transcript_4502:69-965(+)